MGHISLIIRKLGLYLTVAVLGFAVGAAALYIYTVNSGPSLKLWHTTALTTEFKVQNAEDIKTFGAYKELEEVLFRQLDDQIYARSENGPAFVLARYSSGSAADPRRRKPNWNRSFELPATPPAGGVLLLHGMSDSPYSLRALGLSFNRHGYWALGLRLPGHGTAPSGLATVKWEDMATAVKLGMRHLVSKAGHQSIHLVGYSTGAALAVNYVLDVLDGAASPMPASLVLISPAISISPVAALAKWKCRLGFLPGLEKLAWAGIRPEFDPFKYNSFAVNAADQVHRLTRAVTRGVQARAASGPIALFPPTLVFLSSVDATVSTAGVIDNLLSHLAPGRNELVLFDINRSNVNTSLLVSNPSPLTARLLADGRLPFRLTLIANQNAESNKVVSRRKAAFSTDTRSQPLNLFWPEGVISLSHVALPFPPDDPLYGQRQTGNNDLLHLGQIAFKGERDLLKFSADWLMRLRHNPFYDFLQTRAIEWVEGTSGLAQ